MARFLVLTSRGLESAVERELNELGYSTERTSEGVYFDGEWKDAYKANLWLRSATRVLFPLADFEAQSQDDLYNGVKAIDFTQWISPEKTLLVEANVRNSRFRDQRFVALKTKDAIVDQIREKSGARPSVDKADPDLRVYVRVFNQKVSIAIDTSGESLTKRGYRKEVTAAPLKEHLAAGLLLLTGWEKDVPIIDPMCGSGTIVIEAALMALNIAPGLFRNSFAFQKLPNFHEEEWQALVDEAIEKEKDECPVKILGSDRSGDAIKKAEKNAAAAGVDAWIQFEKMCVDEVENEFDRGIMVVNPPYGERIGEEKYLKDDYKDLAYSLKHHFKGWTAWILAGEPKLTKALELKSSLKIPVFNGPIECRLLKYEIF